MSSKPWVAMFLREAANEYQAVMREECRAEALRHGLTLREYDAENDSRKQVQRIQDCLRWPDAERPRAILVSPVDEAALGEVAREAARRGVAWVSLNRACDYLAELRREFPRATAFSVHPDQDQVGRIQASHVRLLLPKGGGVAYIRGPIGAVSANQRSASFRGTLEGSGIRVTELSADWSIEGGCKAANEWLSAAERPRVDAWVVAAQNDSMAKGARGAVVDAARKTGDPSLLGIPVVGCDGALGFGYRWVHDRTLRATVIIPSPGRRAVNALAAVLAGATPPSADICFPVSSFPVSFV